MNKSNYGLRSFRKNRNNPFEIKHKETKENYPTLLQINSEFLPKIFGLSKTGIKVLMYFLKNYTDKDLNEINFYLDECKYFSGFNDRRSIYNGLIELLGEGIIARTKNENIYYLNVGIIKIID